MSLGWDNWPKCSHKSGPIHNLCWHFQHFFGHKLWLWSLERKLGHYRKQISWSRLFRSVMTVDDDFTVVKPTASDVVSSIQCDSGLMKTMQGFLFGQWPAIFTVCELLCHQQLLSLKHSLALQQVLGVFTLYLLLLHLKRKQLYNITTDCHLKGWNVIHSRKIFLVTKQTNWTNYFFNILLSVYIKYACLV